MEIEKVDKAYQIKCKIETIEYQIAEIKRTKEPVSSGSTHRVLKYSLYGEYERCKILITEFDNEKGLNINDLLQFLENLKSELTHELSLL